MIAMWQALVVLLDERPSADEDAAVAQIGSEGEMPILDLGRLLVRLGAGAHRTLTREPAARAASSSGLRSRRLDSQRREPPALLLPGSRRPSARRPPLVVLKLETEIRIAARPCHSVAPSQHVPSSWTRRTTSRVVSSSSPKRTSTWLRTTSLRISTPGSAPSRSAKRARVVAAALDEIGDAVATERAQSRPDGEAARAARRLRHPVGRAPAIRRAGDSWRRPPSPAPCASGCRQKTTPQS